MLVLLLSKGSGLGGGVPLSVEYLPSHLLQALGLVPSTWTTATHTHPIPELTPTPPSQARVRTSA